MYMSVSVFVFTHNHTGTVLSTGPLYTVAEGDFLEALSNRFLVSVDDLMLSNPDVVRMRVYVCVCVHVHVCVHVCVCVCATM